MKYQFKVYSYHPEEYRREFYSLFDEEKVDYRRVIEETAPPPELIKDIVVFTASSLSILKILYDFYKETKKKKGKMVIRINGKEFDLEAYNIEELKLKIESEFGLSTKAKDE
jgi:hypothetical protein